MYSKYASPAYDIPGRGMGPEFDRGVAGRDRGLRIGSSIRSRWEERDDDNVIVKLANNEDGDVAMGGSGSGSGYEMLPESRDEHEKYYVKKPMVGDEDEDEDGGSYS